MEVSVQTWIIRYSFTIIIPSHWKIISNIKSTHINWGTRLFQPNFYFWYSPWFRLFLFPTLNLQWKQNLGQLSFSQRGLRDLLLYQVCIFLTLFKGGGVKGVMNNVKKNCIIFEEWHPWCFPLELWQTSIFHLICILYCWPWQASTICICILFVICEMFPSGKHYYFVRFVFCIADADLWQTSELRLCVYFRLLSFSYIFILS